MKNAQRSVYIKKAAESSLPPDLQTQTLKAQGGISLMKSKRTVPGGPGKSHSFRRGRAAVRAFDGVFPSMCRGCAGRAGTLRLNTDPIAVSLFGSLRVCGPVRVRAAVRAVVCPADPRLVLPARLYRRGDPYRMDRRISCWRTRNPFFA